MASDTRHTILADQHRDDLQALAKVLPHAAGLLDYLAWDRTNETEIKQVADALFETCTILSDMGVHSSDAPREAAVAYLTYRGRLIKAIRRCYRRAREDGRVTA